MGISDKTNTEKKPESKNLLTISGNQAKIKGTIEVDESIDVNCSIDGVVKVKGKIIIQKEGYVKAEVTTQDAVISGRYEGNMKANGKAEVTKKGILKGTVTTDRIIINDGGIFSGTVKRISEVSNKKVSSKKVSNKKVSSKKVSSKKVSNKKVSTFVEKPEAKISTEKKDLSDQFNWNRQ